MSPPLRLIIFDVDGTLVDSQRDIIASMHHAYGRAGLTAPDNETLLSIVGLSLPQAFDRLAPQQPREVRDNLVAWYKEAYMALRAETGVAASSPLYPHVREILGQLHAVPDYLLGVATGKSQRGLDKLVDGLDLRRYFVTLQSADHHPSKPHPSMIETALRETGVAVADAVMIGDTTFDMEMARAAGVAAIGVSWGYHTLSTPELADYLLNDIRELPALLDRIWGR